jgi:excisionase family DNA binding protein
MKDKAMTVLTHQEAAAFLKVNDATLRKLRRQGDIHGTLVGSQYRYLLEHLEAYLRGSLPAFSTAAVDLLGPTSDATTALDPPRRAVHHRSFYTVKRAIQN